MGEFIVEFLQQLVSGLASGGLYALMALAVVLVYKATDMVNFAQAAMAGVCGYVAMSLLTRAEVGYVWALPAVVLFGALTGIVGDRLLFRPLLVKGVAPLVFVIATLGLSMMISNLTIVIWGPQPFPIPSLFPQQSVTFAGLAMAVERLAIIGVAVGLLILIALYFRFTKTGLAMRAAAENRAVATLMGVHVPNTFGMTWALASGLGGLVGLLFANVIFVQPDYMDAVLIKAFVAAVLGGLRSFQGAVFAGLLIGVIENMTGYYISGEFKELLPLVIVMAALMVRPTGLFGREVTKRA